MLSMARLYHGYTYYGQSGETALDIAKENAKPEIVRLLEDPATYPAVVVAQVRQDAWSYSL